MSQKLTIRNVLKFWSIIIAAAFIPQILSAAGWNSFGHFWLVEKDAEILKIENVRGHVSDDTLSNLCYLGYSYSYHPDTPEQKTFTIEDKPSYIPANNLLKININAVKITIDAESFTDNPTEGWKWQEIINDENRFFDLPFNEFTLDEAVGFLSCTESHDKLRKKILKEICDIDYFEATKKISLEKIYRKLIDCTY